ncbi:MAG: hypothetical protein ABIQ44_03930, partial [Chloroflexia bacterium]
MLEQAARPIEVDDAGVKATPLPDAVVAEIKPPISRWPRWLVHLAVLLGFALLTTVATWPMLPQLGGYVIDKGDPLYSVWAMAWQAHSLTTDPLHFYDANI